MQRMIRQFAAEYTSKNSSTQDSSQPNSTKNQSLPKSPSRQSSPPPATTQNPVLSKLLMADQDSPLDLTIKKPQSEEPCEQADGVLDLSTKKSPCSGSTLSSISPSTSNAIGNGTPKRESKAVDPCNSTSSTLEKFMVKLCAHHQTQFLLVLNSLCTEEPFLNSKSASILDVKTANIDDHSHCSSEQCIRQTGIYSNSMETSTNSAAVCADMENFPSEVEQNKNILKSPVLIGLEENSAPEMGVLNIFSHSSLQEEKTAKNHMLHVKPPEENSQLLQSEESGCTKKIEPLHTDISECSILSHSNLTLTPVTSTQEAEFPINLPKCADKENAQCISPRQANLDIDIDCTLKQNSVNTVVTKLGNNLNHYESFQTCNDGTLPHLDKIRSQENIKYSKTSKRYKSTPSLRKCDCDSKCDVVYIDPITAQYHFHHQKPLHFSRNTARKSTRGYLINEDCCQLSAVRTLVRSTKVEDKGNCALHFAEALIIPDRVTTETLPLADVSLVHSEETCVEIGTVNSLTQNDLDTPICKVSGNTEGVSSIVEQSVNATDSLLAVFAVVHDGNENPSFSGLHAENEILQKKSLDVTMEQGVVPLNVSKIHGNRLEKSSSELAYPVFVEDKKKSTLTSLDGDLMVSLKGETMLSENNNQEVAAIEIFSQKSIIEKNYVPLEDSTLSPSTSFSVLPYSNIIENNVMAPSTSSFFLGQINSKIEKSVVIVKDLEFTPVHLGVDTFENCIATKDFENSNSDLLPQNCSLVNLGENVAKKIVKDCLIVSSPKKTEHFHEDCIGKQYPCLYVGPTEKITLNNVETTNTTELIRFSTFDKKSDISTEDVQSLLDKCAKICEPNDFQFKDMSTTKPDVQQCNSVTSFENKCKIEKSSQTKEINEDNNSKVAKRRMLHNLLPSNNVNEKIPSPTKKIKKTPIPTDRRLRSSETQTDASTKEKASLQIQISQLPGAKSSHRSVEFRDECTMPYGLSTRINSSFKESLDGKNHSLHFLSNQFAEDKTLLSERMFKNTISSTPKRIENVSIHFEIRSEERKVYFCSKSKVEGKESSSPEMLKDDCMFKFKTCKRIPADTSVSFAQTRSKTKSVAVNSLIGHKEKPIKAKALERLSVKNEKQSSKCKKSFAFTNMSIPLNSSNHKEIVTPKFIEWCFEEENQERISSFNNQYVSIHNNWIPLEKDVSTGPKCKNKADKLKEIWKTKKRVRKYKLMEEIQKNSPVQMLFMNSYTFSDICRWFLETTETKSLVIVKKLNTRIPEEHQLPFPPSQKHSPQDLYPHTLQAERLKKHLKKFASAYPVSSNAKTQNALVKLDNKVQPDESSKISVIGTSDSRSSGSKPPTNKQTSDRILSKYSHFREKLHNPSVPLNKNKEPEQKSAKMNHVRIIKRLPSSKLNSQTAANSPVCKLVITDEKQKARKRPKDDQLNPGATTSKRRKTEINQEFDKNRHVLLKNALPTKKDNRKMEGRDAVAKFQAPKSQKVKDQVSKAAILKKGKTKTAMQKKTSKTQLVAQKCRTRSSKLRPAPPVLSEQRITRASQPWMKEFHRKLCTGSKTETTQILETRRNRSQIDSSTQSR